ncbi:hypothetical protein RhiirB3_440745, partial [Rhizophagus irregularis]
SIIHRLAARKLIQDLDDETSFLHKNPKNVGKNIPDSLIKDNIVKLGKTFNLASKYTSFIGIDERISEPNEVLIKPKQIYVPQSVPASGSHVGATVVKIRHCAIKSTGGKAPTKLPDSLASQLEIKINHKEPNIKNLFEFLGLQSFNEVLSTCISMKYLEIIMFENFKDECEMCYEKAEKALKKMVENDVKRNAISEKAKKWIHNWVNEQE